MFLPQNAELAVPPGQGRFPQVKFRVQYKFSDLNMYDDWLNNFRDYLREDFNEYDHILNYQEKMSRPFELEVVRRFDRTATEALSKNDYIDWQADQEENKADWQKNGEKRIDDATMVIAKKLGFVEIVWLTLARFLTYGQLVLSAITGFMKPDFLTQAAIGLAILYFNFPEPVKRHDFIILTGMVLISIAYDLFWIYFITDFDDMHSTADRNEMAIRLFSLRVCYVSVFWRVSLLL